MPDLNFTLDIREPGKHELHLALEIEVGLWPKTGEGHELYLPVWTPGSYLIREYSRHVTELRAVDTANGKAIKIAKTQKNRWRFELTPSVKRVRVSWRVYAHELTVRTADVTEDHAFWNGACVFLWPVGGTSLDAAVDVRMPDGWQLATSLARDPSAGKAERLLARDLDDLVDSPCLAGKLCTLSFDVLGVPHSFALDGLGAIKPPPSLISDTQRVIAEAAKIFDGKLPYASYQFLSLFSDAGRGGLEHLTSSVLLAPRTTFAPRKAYEDFLSLVAHEHFHLWNVKRMRPSTLWRFDYERENYTTLLWVAEGFTSYYDDHLCLRAGVITRERYLEILGEAIADLRSVPGRLAHPLALASFDAWIKFYRPDEHTKNSTQSYYSSGALATLCLDLKIRAATRGGRSLDDALADLYRRSFLKNRGYTHEDVVLCLNAAAGCDLTQFVSDLVDGPFEPDFAATLEPFGVRIAKKAETGAFVGMQLQSDELVIQNVTAGDPAHAAGLAPGDELLAFDGLRIKGGTWKNVLEQLWTPGKSVRVLLARRGKILEHTLTPVAAPESLRLEIIPDATDAQKLLRRGWLCEKADAK